MGSFGRTSVVYNFDLDSPWSASYWERKAIIDFEHNTDSADWDRWNEHATHGTEEHEPQRHALEPVHASRKQAWMGWGPDVANGSHHKVADWDWDNHLNAYVSTASPRRFTCDCGQKHEVPGYSNCKCGKIWNSYVIGTGGDRHEASAEKFLCREIVARDGVIVANKRMGGSGTFGDLNEGDEIFSSSRGSPVSIGGDYHHRVHSIEEGKSGKTRRVTLETVSSPSDQDWPPGSKNTRVHKHTTPLPPAWTVRRPKQAFNLDDVVGDHRGGYDLDDEVEDNTPFPSSHLPKVKDTMGSGGSDWHSRSPDGKWTPGGNNLNRFKKKT